MKRVFDEISDDEWADHDFKPSRVLGVTQHNGKQRKSAHRAPPPPPPIESFAFGKSSQSCEPGQAAAAGVISDDDDDDCVDITDHVKALEDVDNLEDDDVVVEEEEEEEEVEARPTVNRCRRFVIDDDEQEEDEVEKEELTEVYEIGSSDEELGLEMGEDDVVGKALQKCSKISAELKRELYGSATTSCQRYAEVLASSVRIVTQNDINAACAVEDSNFQPILKPYQLVGVNFLLLLYRKGIGGAILADEMGLGKTIQAITYLMLLKHMNNDPGPHLIVCPASVLENWERELKKWCPSFSILQYHGANRSAYSKELISLAKMCSRKMIVKF